MRLLFVMGHYIETMFTFMLKLVDEELCHCILDEDESVISFSLLNVVIIIRYRLNQSTTTPKEGGL